MRNFCSALPHVLAVNLAEDVDKSLMQHEACIEVIMAAMMTSLGNTSPSEEYCIGSFTMWYGNKRAQHLREEAPHDRNFDRVPDGWTYINLNTGTIVTFVAVLYDGYSGDSTAFVSFDWQGQELTDILGDLRGAKFAVQ